MPERRNSGRNGIPALDELALLALPCLTPLATYAIVFLRYNTISLERDYLSPRAIYYSSRATDNDDDNNSAKTTMQSPELQLASFHSWHVILNNVSLVAIFIIQSG